VLFGVGQVWQITNLPAKQSVSWYLSFFLFVLFALMIASHECKNTPSSSALERRWAYRLWLVVACINLGYSVIMKALVRAEIWATNDWINLSIFTCAFAISVSIALGKRLALTDSVSRGMFALSLKAIPQWWLAWVIVQTPGSAPSNLAILAGLITIAVRITMLGNPITWNRDQKGLALAEYSNFLSWGSVAVVSWFL